MPARNAKFLEMSVLQGAAPSPPQRLRWRPGHLVGDGIAGTARHNPKTYSIDVGEVFFSSGAIAMTLFG
jgi:hypothetical protein